MTDNVDVNELYDPIVHQEDHMKDHIGFRINAGEFEGVFVKMLLNNIRYYPDLEDYSFEWNVFGNNHNVPIEKFKTQEFYDIMRKILDHMTKEQVRKMIEELPEKKDPINLDDYEDKQSQTKSNELMIQLFEEMQQSGNVHIMPTQESN